MIRPDAFVHELSRAGFGVVSGVPCSYLTPLINTVIDSDEVRYVGAANEGDAVAIACGAELGGAGGVVMFQNSGFGNAVNPLTSLTATLAIPLLVIVTWRGHPDQPPDEPQHAMMGRITPRLMELMDIPWEPFPDREEDVTPVLGRALAHMRTRRTPYGLIMTKGSVEERELRTRPDLARVMEVQVAPERSSGERVDQDDVMRAVQESTTERDVILAATGFTGRALYAQGDRPNQLYMVGSMGCASSLGLGLAITQESRRVIVLDGDGALLMRLGALATIGREQPPNLVHVLLDNAVHDSTGGQATVSPWVDFAGVARACGYPDSAWVKDAGGLASALRDESPGLRFLHVRTNPRADRALPRPSVTPAEVALRLRDWMGALA